MRLVRRVVLDTGVLVSAALRPGSTPSEAYALAVRSCEVCASEATLSELDRILALRKFDRYLDAGTRSEFRGLCRRHARVFEIADEDVRNLPTRCRDPGDDMFLALGLACGADVIVSGDGDLIDLSPYHGIPILTPGKFLQ